jgi:hypothetical protein
LTHSLQLRLPRLVFGSRSFLKNVFVRLPTQLLFVTLGNEIHLGSPGIFDGLATESEKDCAQQKDVPVQSFNYLSHLFFLPSKIFRGGVSFSPSRRLREASRAILVVSNKRAAVAVGFKTFKPFNRHAPFKPLDRLQEFFRRSRRVINEQAVFNSWNGAKR